MTARSSASPLSQQKKKKKKEKKALLILDGLRAPKRGRSGRFWDGKDGGGGPGALKELNPKKKGKTRGERRAGRKKRGRERGEALNFAGA